MRIKSLSKIKRFSIFMMRMVIVKYEIILILKSKEISMNSCNVHIHEGIIFENLNGPKEYANGIADL